MTKSFKNFSKQRKTEHFYKEAKKKEVRARSYFKLEQLDKKFSLIKENAKVLDLGCAPGGWLEYMDDKLEEAELVGIDLLPIKNKHLFSKKVSILEDDFYNLEDYELGAFDLVLSDMAPEFSGQSEVDRGRVHKINLDVLGLCKIHLKKGGTCAFKSFEGEDFDKVLAKARKLFSSVKVFKPVSSQKKSAEVFVVCFDFQP
ncbi:RlmE family RNA methyltransferase [Candidatus Woesearchaeota archaeon]|nr:RlmE family RNA methyltransferase [Nanoarchaeota archaeon]MCB9370600.1 RlmE family RNA methyltransferase [Candidatus Woesearchaeota archaeon]USN43681.1 MAG: RlmE family RNA methyltransferase [Candidatus Woesearchaeota archaeon]